MRVGSTQRGQKASPIQAIRPAQDVQASSGSSDALSQQFSQIVDNFAAQAGASDVNADSAFADALQVGGEIQLIVPQTAQSNAAPEPSATSVALAGTQVQADTQDRRGNRNQEQGQDAREESTRDEEVTNTSAERITARESSTSSRQEQQSDDKTEANPQVEAVDGEKDASTPLVEEVAAKSEGSILNEAAPEWVEQLSEQALTPQGGVEQGELSAVSTKVQSQAAQEVKEGEASTKVSSTGTTEASKNLGTQAVEVAPELTQESLTAESSSETSETGPLLASNVETARTSNAKASNDLQVLKTEIAALIRALEAPIQSVVAQAGREKDAGLLSREVQNSNNLFSTSAKPVSTVDAGAQAKLAASNSRDNSPRASRAIPPAQMARTMEKVEQALKEAARARDGKTISLRLDPPDLGTLKVDVSLREGTLRARVVVEQSAVYQQLREKAHELHAALRKLGLNVDAISVSVSAENQSSFSMEQHVRREQNEATGFASDLPQHGEAESELAKAQSSKTAVIDNGWVA